MSDDVKNNLNYMLDWIYPINIFISIYCAVVLIKRDDPEFLQGLFVATIVFIGAGLGPTIISRYLCGNYLTRYFFITLYLYLSFYIHKLSITLSFFQIIFLILFYIFNKYYNIIKGNVMEKKFNNMCYGKKHLSIFNRKFNKNSCKNSGVDVKYGYDIVTYNKLNTLLNLIKLNITKIPFPVLKKKSLEELQNIMYSKMESYGLNLKIVEMKNMTFIRLWIDFKDDYPNHAITKEKLEYMTMNDLFILYHGKKMNIMNLSKKNNNYVLLINLLVIIAQLIKILLQLKMILMIC